MNEYATPIFALIGTIFGGAGLEIVRRWLNRSKIRDDTATELRKELREELAGLKKELDDVEAELDAWKNRYYDLLQQFVSVKGQLEEALRHIQRDAGHAADRTARIQPPEHPLD
jgi:chromosome segregation ATPase